MFEKLALIGIGLIGSSIARATRLKGLAKTIAISTRKQETLDEARGLGLGDFYSARPDRGREGRRPRDPLHPRAGLWPR